MATVQKMRPCSSCNGEGAIICQRCGGTGVEHVPITNEEVPCANEKCQGGKIVCDKCNGSKQESYTEVVPDSPKPEPKPEPKPAPKPAPEPQTQTKPPVQSTTSTVTPTPSPAPAEEKQAAKIAMIGTFIGIVLGAICGGHPIIGAIVGFVAASVIITKINN